MGTVVLFPEARRAPRQNPPVRAGAATVVILPVIRIERAGTRSPVSSLASSTQSSKPPSGRKRRKRATPT